MRWEALGANADFWSQVLQSLSLHAMHFALGAAMLTTRHQLQRVGGFAALADHLADDYELGHRLARTGAKAILSTEVVECRSAPLTFGEVWCHQLRWARTIRVCQPVPAFLSIIGNASLWPLLWVALTPSALSFGFALLCLSFRQLAAALLERRFTGRVDASTWGMPVLKDLLQVLIWALSFSGKQVTWRGTRYRIEVSGKLIPLREVEAK
jgi:ceramide glucosyltransferase